jgi:hypothetical protein
MLDLLGIVLSSGIMLLVILRAIQLDGLQPWFRPPKTGADSSGLRLRPEGPGGDSQSARARGQAARRDVTRGG